MPKEFLARLHFGNEDPNDEYDALLEGEIAWVYPKSEHNYIVRFINPAADMLSYLGVFLHAIDTIPATPDEEKLWQKSIDEYQNWPSGYFTPLDARDIVELRKQNGFSKIL